MENSNYLTKRIIWQREEPREKRKTRFPNNCVCVHYYYCGYYYI